MAVPLNLDLAFAPLIYANFGLSIKSRARYKDKESIYRSKSNQRTRSCAVALASAICVTFLLIPWVFGWNATEAPPDAVIDAKLDADGCFPVKAQKKSLASAPGDYDVFLLARWNLNGLCAVDSDRPVCRTSVRSSQVTTSVRGMWPIRERCGRDVDEGAVGHHWPQYCVSSGGYLNGTAFGLLAAASPPPQVKLTLLGH
jgi:hypothetical protein